MGTPNSSAQMPSYCFKEQEAIALFENRGEVRVAFGTSAQHKSRMWTASPKNGTWTQWNAVLYYPPEEIDGQKYYCRLDKGTEWGKPTGEDAQRISRAISAQENPEPKELFATPKSETKGYLVITADPKSGKWSVYLLLPFAFEDEDEVRFLLAPLEEGGMWRDWRTAQEPASTYNYYQGEGA